MSSRRSSSGPQDARVLWAKAEGEARRKGLEDLLAWHIKTWGLPRPEREHRFDPVRQWRFDFAWPPFMVAAEVEGTTPSGGRHQRQQGFERDAEKYAAAALAGWTVLRFTGRMVRSAYAIRAIQVALERATIGTHSFPRPPS